MSSHPIYAVWAVPRSASTAFERMCIERGDLRVRHEPYAAGYYYGADRRHQRFAPEGPPDPGNGFAALTASLLRTATEGPVLLKDMAYYVAHRPALLDNFVNSFLIRHPRASLASLHRQLPDFTEEEAGFLALEQLFEREQLRLGRTPPLLDANDLCANPAGMIAAWCEAIGLPFMPAALHWRPGALPEWAGRDQFHDAVALTRGFEALPDPRKQALPEAPALDCLPRCLAIYERLHALRLRPR